VITEQQEKVKVAEEEVKGGMKEADLRTALGTKCLQLRGAVMKYFEDTMNKANGESNPEIKAIVAKKMPEWKDGYEEHKRAMAEVTDGIKKCQDWAAGR